MSSVAKSRAQRREFPRYDVQCRARILIGKRHYTGYIHNISQGGAKLRTISHIRRIGEVVLRLPDLPPFRCHLRWTDAYNAGVSFSLILPKRDLAEWTELRSSFSSHQGSAEIAEFEEMVA